jgi:hypothetical protein
MCPARVLRTVLVLALLLPAGADAKKLRHKPTGFQTTAPRGFKLRVGADGSYTIESKRSYAHLLLADSTMEADYAGEEILRALGGRVTGREKGTPEEFAASVAVNNLLLRLEVRRDGKNLRVVTYGPRLGRKRKARGRLVPLENGLVELTPEQLAVLRQIVGQAQGGNARRLPGDIPLRQFVARDGSAQAFVPDLPGWQFNGLQGVIEGGHPDQGVFAFGVSYLVQFPNAPFRSPGVPAAFPPLSQAELPAVMFGDVLPQWFQICCRVAFAGAQVTGVVPNTEGLLAGGFSGMYGVRLTFGGRQAEGLFHVFANVQSLIDFSWLFYYSFIAVVLPAQPGLGNALIQTWASWDPSADQARRRNATLYSILTTNFGSGPIDQDVFDEAARKWSEYIRQ